MTYPPASSRSTDRTAPPCLVEPLVPAWHGHCSERVEYAVCLSHSITEGDTDMEPIIQQQSMVLGIFVGFLIESLSLAWHAAVIQEQSPTSSAPIIVALLLWTLVTTTAPFVALAYLVQWIREREHSADRRSAGATAWMQRRIEQWFSLGTVVGVGWASLTLDAVLGYRNHVRFSLVVAAATASWCLVLSRVYRSWLWRSPRAWQRTKMYDSVDPEQMDTVELAPGSLTL